jgi:LPXTG-motif cell wall-anchored protein
MKIKQRLFLIVLIGNLICFSYTKPIIAADVTVTCTNQCIASTSDPLFSETNIYPLWTGTKSISIENLNPEPIGVYLHLKTSSDRKLDPVIKIAVTNGATTLIDYQTVEEWSDQGFIYLTHLNPESKQEYNFAAQMANVGNEYQNQTTRFDLALQFETGAVLSARDAQNQSPSPMILGAKLPLTGSNFLVFLIVGLLLIVIGILFRYRSSQSTSQN